MLLFITLRRKCAKFSNDFPFRVHSFIHYQTNVNKQMYIVSLILQHVFKRNMSNDELVVL